MMFNIDIKQSIAERKLFFQWSFFDYLFEWITRVLVLFGIPYLILSHKSIKGDLLSSIIVGTAVIGFIVSIFLIARHDGEIVIRKGQSFNQNKKRIIKIINELEWNILVNNSEYLIVNAGFSGRDYFIVLFTGNDMLFGSFKYGKAGTVVFKSESNMRTILKKWDA